MFDENNLRGTWPRKANGQPKKLSEMTAEECRAVARDSLGPDLAEEVGPDYLTDFNRVFDEVFG